MSPLHLSYKSSFLFQNVGHSHDALCMCKIVRDWVETKFGTQSLLLEEHYYFTWSRPDHAAEEGHVGVLVQPSFSFQKTSFRGKEEGLLSTSREHGPKTSAAKSGA